MADRVKVFALGGLDENGRDCYVVEINDDIFVLDAGLTIPDKNLPGVDYILPNASYLFEHKDKIRAYIMSHGHDENMGALKYLYSQAPAPIYCTRTTHMVIEGQMIIQSKVVQMNFVEVNPSDDVVIANRKIRLFQTCHNAANSFGVAIPTDQGNIIYTGDFIISFATDEPNYRFDLKKSAEIAEEKTLLLLADSKSASRLGYCSPKHRIHDQVSKYFKDDRRIFVTCYWQNMYRIREIARLVKEQHKKIYCYDDYTSKVLKHMMNANTGVNLTPNDIVRKEDFLRCKQDELVILILGHDDDIFDEIKALALHNNADSRISVNPNDIFINVAVPRELFETKATRSIDLLYKTGCEVVWLKSKHVISMHPCEDDLRFIINLFRPQYYMPVRGNFTELMANAKSAVNLGLGLNYMNTFVLDNGVQLIFEPGKRPVILPNEVNGVDVTPVLVDGNGITTMTPEIVEVRQRMGLDGAVVIASTVSLEKKRIISGPDCQMRGFVYVKEAEPLLKSITKIYIEEVEGALNRGIQDFKDVRENIIDRVKKFIRRQNGREPFVDPIIIVDK